MLHAIATPSRYIAILGPCNATIPCAMRFYTEGLIRHGGFLRLSPAVKRQMWLPLGSEIRLAPEPGAHRGRFGEVEAEGRQPGVLGIDVGAFEIEDDVIQRLDRRQLAKLADRQGRFPIRAFETGVAGKGIDDPAETELLEELDGFDCSV